MQTFPLNALAEQLEVDRGVMLRAMRDVKPDLVKAGNRPTWKVATAARALEAHRQKNNDYSGVAVNIDLQRMFIQLMNCITRSKARKPLRSGDS